MNTELIDQDDQEIGEFQDDVRDLVIKLSGAPESTIDGKGSDAGWQEFTLAEIGQGFAFLKDKMEELERQNAALRAALEMVIDTTFKDATGQHPTHAWISRETHEKIRAALQPDAGRDFIPREQVKPLADAIRAISEAVDKMSRTEDRQELADGFTAAETARRNGLAHAKTLGF